MSTRATITVADKHDSFDIYQHHDGYPDGPHGLVRHLNLAQRLAWDLPRFEAADFAAAVVAVLKDRGGSTYLTADADAHSDRDYHYRISPLRDEVSTRVQLVVSQRSWQEDKPYEVLFSGDLPAAVGQFNAVAEHSDQPRERQVLEPIEGALYRAEEEIRQWFKGTPDPDTQGVLEDLDDAGRLMCSLRHHLEKSDPWAALKQAATILESLDVDPANRHTGIARTEIRMAMEAHRRWQRD
ncbi:MAG: hypothetical protein COC12_01840 [Rhodobacteraceae bacterium]|nr:MAG: hypothetical protein COC12_01840 [Paracoccaceae bacterium]